MNVNLFDGAYFDIGQEKNCDYWTGYERALRVESSPENEQECRGYFYRETRL